jgi:hypothetical protein
LDFLPQDYPIVENLGHKFQLELKFKLKKLNYTVSQGKKLVRPHLNQQVGHDGSICDASYMGGCR